MDEAKLAADRRAEVLHLLRQISGVDIPDLFEGSPSREELVELGRFVTVLRTAYFGVQTAHLNGLSGLDRVAW